MKYCHEKKYLTKKNFIKTFKNVGVFCRRKAKVKIEKKTEQKLEEKLYSVTLTHQVLGG